MPRGYEDLFEQWRKEGPAALLKYDWRRVEHRLPDEDRVVLRGFLEAICKQTEWIVEDQTTREKELAHIAAIGTVMKRAGLRSYTDKDGRIFVAEDT